jgi:hypothetical protein
MLLLTALSELSILDEELEKLKLEVWLAVMLLFTALSELSMLDEELERLRLEV